MKFLSYGVMIYMLMALVWWTILLTRNNNILLNKSITLAKHEILATGQLNNSLVEDHPEIIKIYSEYNKKRYMILGEGMVFGISLIIGMWFIQKAYNKEIENTSKQKNFLLSVSHELKSPIAAINLITETLLKRTLPKEKVTDLHTNIISESNRLEKLISNLLLASRINNSYYYHFEPVDLLTIAEDVLKKTQIQCPEVKINRNFSKDAFLLEADKEAIVSVITNLIENSIKYSKAPAYITVSVSQHGKNAILEVADKGLGIPDNEKRKIWQQFYRIGSEETRQTKGTGLGLYIVDKIVKAHNGKLKVSDNLPFGTIFTITLPLKHTI